MSKTPKRPTIVDVAREAGVSITTVSRYLNQQFASMGVDTRERIRRVIEDLNYQPNTLAQGLKGNHTQLIAAVMVNLGYPFCVSVIRSMTEILTPAGYNLLVSETGGDVERERQLLQSLASQRVDGLVLQTNGQNNHTVQELAEEMPVVLVDRQFSIPGLTSVVTNNKEASHDLTRRLFEEGYREVIYVSEALEGITTRTQRLAGYEEACLAQAHDSQVVWVNRQFPDSFEAVLRKVRGLSQCYPVAVYTANGLLMMELYPWLGKLEADIPQQLGLATFDEPDWAQIASPPLTCIRQPTREMGQIAARHILKKIEVSRKVKASSLKIVDSEVILRDSSNPSKPSKATKTL